MTLTTHIYVHEPVDPEKLFAIGRAVIGITPDAPYEVEPSTDYLGGTAMRSQMGLGFRSMYWLDIIPDGKPVDAPSGLWSKAWRMKPGVTNPWTQEDEEKLLEQIAKAPYREVCPDDDTCDYGTCEKVHGMAFTRPTFAVVMLDTSYGGTKCAACTHRDIVGGIIEQVGLVEYSWNDESTGKYFSVPPEATCPFHGGAR